MRLGTRRLNEKNNEKRNRDENSQNTEKNLRNGHIDINNGNAGSEDVEVDCLKRGDAHTEKDTVGDAECKPKNADQKQHEATSAEKQCDTIECHQNTQVIQSRNRMAKNQRNSRKQRTRMQATDYDIHEE